MAYEGHIAGLGDRPPGKRLQGRVIEWLQSRSAEEIRGRRAAVVAAVSELAELEFVNGGGTGSLHGTTGEDAVTELAAGSGFFAPTLFDTYSAFSLRPAAMFAMPVVRKPSPSIATVLGGGYLASGLGEPSRVPSPYLPARPPARPLRGRRRGADPGAGRRGRAACASATGSTSGTPRRASCASGSIPSTWCRATRSSTRSRPTGARAAPSCSRVQAGWPRRREVADLLHDLRRRLAGGTGVERRLGVVLDQELDRLRELVA